MMQYIKTTKTTALFFILILCFTSVNAESLVVVNEIVNINENSEFYEKRREYDINRDLDVNGIFEIKVTNRDSSLSRLLLDISLASVSMLSSNFPFPEIDPTNSTDSKVKLHLDMTPGENVSLRFLRHKCVEDGGLTIIMDMESLNNQSIEVQIEILIEEKGDGGCSPGTTDFPSIIFPLFFIIIIIIILLLYKKH